MKKLFMSICLLFLFSSLMTATPGVWSGWISDVKCGINVDRDCAKKCAAAGEKLVFVNSDKTVLQVSNPDKVKALAGEHVKVKGTVEKGVLTVSSAEAIKEPQSAGATQPPVKK